MDDRRLGVGCILICGWEADGNGDAEGVNDHARFLIDDLAVGGVILMGRNAGRADRLRATIAELQERNASLGRPPLFVAVDQEGGRVARLRPPDFTAFPPMREVGSGTPPGPLFGKEGVTLAERARDIGATIGRELRSVGINWDFAPVLDVDNNPNNPVIGDRSFGPSAEVVSDMGTAFIRGLQEDAGILACGKHFPGHGDTDVDSHLALPTIRHDLSRLREVELAPFRAAIAAGVGGIMTAHIVFTALDPEVPSTMSRRVITGLLREEMDFDGLVVTDDLVMKAVADRWGPAEAAVQAFLAGCDLLLCCHGRENQVAIRDALADAVESGRIPQARVDESQRRIARARARWARSLNSNEGRM